MREIVYDIVFLVLGLRSSGEATLELHLSLGGRANQRVYLTFHPSIMTLARPTSAAHLIGDRRSAASQ